MTEQAQNIDSDSGFSVKIDIFTGPIDLLLHLVKQNELPIEKVSLADICDQYMGHLGRMQDLDLEIAAEYLVIAATLLSIKASVLLNEPVEMVLDDDGNLIDPHEELLRKLREAQVYREGAFSLSCRNLLGVDVFAPPSALGGIAPPPVPLKDHDPILLGKAFRKLLERTGTSAQFMRISFEAGSIVGRMMEVLNILKREGGKVVFHRVVPEVTSRGSVIVSFIALLELCKRSVIRVQQDVTNEDIWIVLADSADAGVVSNALMESEFDEQPAAAQAVNQ